MSARTCMRSAGDACRRRSTAASTSVIWARPCVVAIMCSTRVSTHRSGTRCELRQRRQRHVLRIDARTSRRSRRRPRGRSRGSGSASSPSRVGEPVAQHVRRLVSSPRPRCRRWRSRARPAPARPSIGTPERRWLTMRCLHDLEGPGEGGVGVAGLDALARARCCLGASAKSWGAPASVASSGSLTAGSGSQSTATSAAASTASSSVAAMTAATASPTWRTRSTERG